MVGFLTVAVGQTAGAPLFDLLMSHVSLHAAVPVFAGLGVAPGLFQFRAGEIERLRPASVSSR